MRLIVGVSDMKASGEEEDLIVTYSLGSCIGIAAYDPVVRVGGILHYLMPRSSSDPTKATANPSMYGDTGIPQLFEALYSLGAVKDRILVYMAGGSMMSESSIFETGKHNITIARKMFWKNNVFITEEHVGGNMPRTLYLDIATGKSWITSKGEKIEF